MSAGDGTPTRARGGPVYRSTFLPLASYTMAAHERVAAGGEPLPAAAFLHGLEEGWEVWESLATELGDEVRAFCLDLPWSGRNRYEWAHDGGVRGYVASALDLVPAPRVAIAHSFGTNALLEHLDASGPGTLAAVVLVSPFYRGAQDFSWPLFHHYLDNFKRFLEAGLRTRRQARREPPPEDAVVLRKVYERIGPVGCLQFLTIFSRTPRLDLSRCALPVLVVGGREDFYSLPEDCEALGRALPRAEVVLLEDCGHFSMIEQPQRLAALVSDFLGRALQPGGIEMAGGARCALG